MSLPQLSKKVNYGNLSLQMKVLFGFQDMWDVVENGYQEPSLEEEEMVAKISMFVVNLEK